MKKKKEEGKLCNTQLLPIFPSHSTSHFIKKEEVIPSLAEVTTHLSISQISQDDKDRRDDHMVTLGQKPKDCTGSRKIHRSHRRGRSLEMLKSMGAPSRSLRELRKGKKGTPTHSREQTPVNLDVFNSADLKSSIEYFSSLSDNVVKPSKKPIMITHGSQQPVIGTSFLTSDISARLRTSEMEPSKHQIDLPTSKDVLTNARLCALLENYRIIDQNFIFSNLIGMTRHGMEGFVQSGVTPLVVDSNLVSTHIPIVKNLMECMEHGDLLVEGFFYTGNMDGAVDDRVEVAVLRSDSQRKIITVWRGTTHLQENPIDKKEFKVAQVNGLEELHSDHLTPILPLFRRAYFEDDLETKVFHLVNKLMETNPFYDLVCTGHSFGGALATLNASRYATLYPVMRVSCLTFGCPKIGGDKWKLHVHSLPNLNVVRVQHASDVNVENVSDSILSHVGHLIVLSQTTNSDSSIASSPSSSPRFKRKAPRGTIKALAYKFDDGLHRVGSSKSRVFKLMKSNRNKQENCHVLSTYIQSMKQFSHDGLPWVADFAGENLGKGVTGVQDEKRSVV